jgi:cytochrome c biogenesis protein
MKRLIAWISDLRLAIGLLIVIAVASGLGTLVPQKENAELYHRVYDAKPWLGLFNGDALLKLQLDHVYSSSWFLALLAWLGLSLILCSWRRQWPALQAALRWIDYSSPRQLSKLNLAETLNCSDADQELNRLQQLLSQRGWQVQPQAHRLAARRGASGRVGPLLVHAGMVVLMVGAAWGALAGQRLERFLAPGNELELLNRRGQTQLTVGLEAFGIERDPAGRPEQFRSQLFLQPGDPSSADAPPATTREISVNHPLRFQGMTVYQADWALAAIQVQLGKSPILELPLQSFPQLGEQVWGIVLPTRPDGSNPVLLALSSEEGPVTVYSADAEILGTLVPGGSAEEIAGIPLTIAGVVPASGLLLKRDPGVPLVYAGFAIALAGGALSLIATRQLWAIAEPDQHKLHVAGLCNRNLAAFSRELPALLSELQQG